MHIILVASDSGSHSPDKPPANPNEASPGTLGFIAVLCVSVGVIFLAISATRKIRKINYREQVRAENEDQTQTNSGKDKS